MKTDGHHLLAKRIILIIVIVAVLIVVGATIWKAGYESGFRAREIQNIGI